MTTVKAAQAGPQLRVAGGKQRSGVLLTGATWIISVLFVFPVVWMIWTSFHSETDAATNPPKVLSAFSVEGYRAFFGGNPWPPILNSLTASIISTILVLCLALPAAYALSIRPVKKWSDVLFFVLST